MRVKNLFSSPLFDTNYEQNDEPSQTIPDQALTIKQILQRFASGQSLEGKTAIYDESESEEYFPDPRYMDLADRQELQENFKEELSYLEERSKSKKANVSEAP
jgi:hypothetical protein